MIHIYDNRIFHLTDGKFSYAFVIDGGRAVHSYYGKAVDVCPDRLGESALAVKAGARDRQCVEIGEQGRGDFRIPSLVVRGQKTAATELIYVSHAVVKRPNIGMPALRGEAETLAVVFRDELCGIEYTAYYSVFDGALARHAEIKNISGKKLTLCTAASALVDLPAGDYELVSLNGAWGRECAIDRNRLSPGIREISSKRHLSSHQHNPFAAVVTPDTREESGEAFGFSLIYSGNFAIRTEVDECGQLRLTCGVDLLEGGITLEKGETFVTPEAVSVYSDCGLGGMSRTFHRLYRKRLIDPRFADKPRPIVVNSWESCYFDFDEARLFEFIDGAEGLGIDTVVARLLI